MAASGGRRTRASERHRRVDRTGVSLRAHRWRVRRRGDRPGVVAGQPGPCPGGQGQAGTRRRRPQPGPQPVPRGGAGGSDARRLHVRGVRRCDAGRRPRAGAGASRPRGGAQRDRGARRGHRRDLLPVPGVRRARPQAARAAARGDVLALPRADDRPALEAVPAGDLAAVEVDQCRRPAAGVRTRTPSARRSPTRSCGSWSAPTRHWGRRSGGSSRTSSRRGTGRSARSWCRARRSTSSTPPCRSTRRRGRPCRSRTPATR